MSKILIIDDEKDIVNLLSDQLTAKGHQVLAAYDGEQGIELAKQQPDLILLDIMMPKVNGFEVCDQIRDELFCPILFLSAKQSESDKIKALNLGGDDYITKPFGLRELIAKIEANLRREKRSQYLNTANKRTKLYFGDLSVDSKGCEVRIAGEKIDFTKREYEIVEFLAFNSGQVFSREQIYEQIWGYGTNGIANTVVEHIKKIRAKLSQHAPSVEYISTVWGIGYKWNRF